MNLNPSEDSPIETQEIDGVECVGPRDALAHFKMVREQQRDAVKLAVPALNRLVNDVLTQRSGQCYKIRSLLFSLWNGKPVSLNEVCGLDYQLRVDLCHVILAWGYGSGEGEFFYDALKSRVSKAGHWEWFLEERFNLELIRDYAKGEPV